MKLTLKHCLFSMLVVCALAPVPALSQQDRTAAQQRSEQPISGTVVSSTRDTLVVRTEDNQFHLFTFDNTTERPRSLPAGTRVRVASTAGDEAGYRTADSITVVQAAPAAGAAGAAPAGTAQPIPREVRQLESDIRRQVRRWRAGIRAGAALDPELILVGAHAQIGPFFHPDVTLRPNIEFAFGEVTNLFALNLEAVYRLPISPRQGRWSAYIGAGPGFTFLHQNFERQQGDGRDIDFGDFNFDSGFNILSGVQFRGGTFFEVKSSIYSRPAPSLRLIFGYNF